MLDIFIVGVGGKKAPSTLSSLEPPPPPTPGDPSAARPVNIPPTYLWVKPLCIYNAIVRSG